MQLWILAVMAAIVNFDVVSNMVTLVSIDLNPSAWVFQQPTKFDIWTASIAILDDDYDAASAKEWSCWISDTELKKSIDEGDEVWISVDGKRLTKVVEGRLLIVAKFR